MNDPKDQQKEVPWWLQGDHQCVWCLQSYALEVEYRCAHCDEPICPDCIVEISFAGLVLCRPCADAYAADSNSER